MILAPILYLVLDLIIAEYMPNLSAHKNKLKFDNCINMQMLTTNNKRLPIMIARNMASNNVATNVLDNNKFFSTIVSTKLLHSHENKHINVDRNNNEPLSSITSIKYLHSHASKYISKNNKDSDSRSKSATTLFSALIKYLAQNKTAYAVVKSSLIEKVKAPILVTRI